MTIPRLELMCLPVLGATMFWPNLELDEPRPGDEYKDNMGVTGAIPVGAGFKYIISDKWMFGYEIGYRQIIFRFHGWI